MEGVETDMGKQTDRIFHLTVAALAITLSAVSLGTMVYQRNPGWVHQWVKQSVPSNLVQPSQKTPSTGPAAVQKPGVSKTAPDKRTSTVTGQTKTGTAASDVAYKPQYHTSNNAMLIQVKGVGQDVTSADLQNIQNTLKNYNIVNLVSQSLQMNVYQAVYILVAKSPADYQQALSSLGVSTQDAKQFTLDTGGFTQGDTIIIPLYQNTTTPDLANSLCHELTHAFLNANVGNFPSWMNEGLAVTNGMHAQALAESNVEYAGYARQMAESILDAEKNGTLQPLVANEAKVLAGTASYDLELQDWLAVRDLIATKGYNAFSDYFYRLNLGESQATAFVRSFGVSEQAFNTAFTNQLRVAANSPNDAVSIEFSIPSSYQGDIRFLQHGTTTWTGFQANPGITTITIENDGSLSPATQLTAPIQDSNPADPATLYINLDPVNPLTYNGQQVRNSGFAIDYHYGLYGYVNSWITLQNGKSLYFHGPSLFGVTLMNIQEQNPNQWLVGLMSPPAISGFTSS